MLTIEFATPFRERFESGYTRGANCDCWEWRLGVGKAGKAILRGTPSMLAVNLAYVLAHGKIPEKHRIVQTCGNDLCVNPGHLKAVTGRIKPSWNAKLDAEIAGRMRAEYLAYCEARTLYRQRVDAAKEARRNGGLASPVGEMPRFGSIASLARKYDVAYGTVHAVIWGRLHRSRKYQWPVR